jgi:chemotaxis protein CheX
MTASPGPSVISGHSQNWTPLLDEAAREVFELMLGCALATPKAAIEETAEITSMVGLGGELCGMVSISCREQAAALMASKMLGVDLDKVGNDVEDAFGEIANMVAGNFKNKIPGIGDGCMLSVPTVVSGSDYRLHTMAESPAIELRLLFENMPIVISLQVSK